MLPERLSVGLSLLLTIALCYIALTHQWNWQTLMVLVLAGVLISTVLGRIFGIVSARELARTPRDTAKSSAVKLSSADQRPTE